MIDIHIRFSTGLLSDGIPCIKVKFSALKHKRLLSVKTYMTWSGLLFLIYRVSKVNERFIEIALRDLQGGVNSTFQTLVNPQHAFPNSHIHGIATNMVNRPDVPR
ncbi:hypothetical protein RJT34_23007 [Clitoria ternatea]|uniref:Uncharacterized protein n=1 Tax=Clitoria ternatea TaxID=43366 RepID=A0AAN9FMW5_CLITE